MQNCIAVWNYKLDNQFSNLLLDTRDGSEFFLSDRIMGQIWKSYNPFFFFSLFSSHRVQSCRNLYYTITLNFLVLGPGFHCFEILSGSVISPPESVGAVKPVSKSIELILLWRRWEPEPWQPSAQISVGRELAGDVHTFRHTHTHAVHKQINICVCVCVLPNRALLSPSWQIQMFIYWLNWLNRVLPLSRRDTRGCVTGLEMIYTQAALPLLLLINTVSVLFFSAVAIIFVISQEILLFPF